MNRLRMCSAKNFERVVRIHPGGQLLLAILCLLGKLCLGAILHLTQKQLCVQGRMNLKLSLSGLSIATTAPLIAHR